MCLLTHLPTAIQFPAQRFLLLWEGWAQCFIVHDVLLLTVATLGHHWQRSKVPPWVFPVCHCHAIFWSLTSSPVFQTFPPARTVIFSSVSLLFSKILSSSQKPGLSTVSFLRVMFSGFPTLSSAHAETICNQTISFCFCSMSLFLLGGGFGAWLCCLSVAKFATNQYALALASGSLVFESSDAQFYSPLPTSIYL